MSTDADRVWIANGPTNEAEAQVVVDALARHRAMATDLERLAALDPFAVALINETGNLAQRRMEARILAALGVVDGTVDVAAVRELVKGATSFLGLVLDDPLRWMLSGEREQWATVVRAAATEVERTENRRVAST